MSSSSSINLAALGFGGIDTANLVTSLVALEQTPITQMQTQQTNINAASASISSYASALSSLKTAAVALASPTTFQAMAATSSSASVVSTTTGAPAAGQWSVSVSQIAQEQRTLSNGTASADTGLGLSGNLAISTGSGGTASINLTTTDSLQDVANAISQSGLGVSASVMYDGSQYHLLVSGQSTGQANSITFDESGLTASSGYSLGMSTPANTIQPAQDAKLTVGNVPITSATNQVANAIPGVTLALTQPTTSPATITIAGDSTALQTEVQSFVTAYNNVVSLGHSTAGYGTTAASNSLLQGDSAIRSSLDQLGQLVTEQVPGTSGGYTTLGSVGITMNDDGTLAFDSSTFSAAVLAAPDAVKALFVTDSNTGSTGVMNAFGSAIDSMTDPTSGSFKAEIDGFSSRNSRLQTEIADGETRITAYQTQLQNEFTQMNKMLAQYKQTASALSESTSSSSSSSSSNGVL